MDCSLDWIIKDLVHHIGASYLQEEPWPEFYKRRIINEVKNICIEGIGFVDYKKTINIKYTQLWGSNMDIATAMIYPIQNVDSIPVLSIEIVKIKDIIHMVVIDVAQVNPLQKIDLSPFESSYKIALKIKLEEKESPKWFQEIRGPFSIYGKCNSQEIDNIREVYNQYLEQFKSYFLSDLNENSCILEDKGVLNHKLHHFKHSPARKVVKNDSEWLEHYLKHYHFGPAYVIH